MRRSMRYLRLGIAFGAFVCVLLLSGCKRDYNLWPGLVDRYKSAVGMVVKTYCHDHGRIGYEFTVDGQRYSNSVYSHPIDKPCAQIRIGEPMMVYYDPTNPRISTLLPPRDAYDRYLDRGNGWIALGFLILLVLLAPLLQMWMGRYDPAFKSFLRRKRGKAMAPSSGEDSDGDSAPKA